MDSGSDDELGGGGDQTGLQQRQERAQMMQLWMEDARLFKQESTKAREERRRLQKIHDKVHDRAEIAR